MKNRLHLLSVLLCITICGKFAGAIDLKDAILNVQHNNDLYQSSLIQYKINFLDFVDSINGVLPSYQVLNVNEDKNYGINRSSNYWISVMKYNMSIASFIGVSAAFDALKANQSLLLLAQQEMIFKTVDVYTGVVFAEQSMNLSINNLQMLEKFASITNEKFKLGDVTNVDVSQATSRLIKARTALESYKNKFEKAKAQYRRFIYDEPKDLNMESVEATIDFLKMPVNLKDFFSACNKSNIELFIKNIVRMSADAKFLMSIANLLPVVSAENTESINNQWINGRNAAAYINRAQKKKTFAFQISVNGLSNYTSIAKSRYYSNKAMFDYIAKKRDLELQILDIWDKIRLSQIALEASNSIVESSELALKGLKQEFDLGARTAIEVLNAEHELFQAKIEALSARKDYVISMYEAAAVAGSLRFDLFK